MTAPDTAIELTLAHSPDPDDVFMWWPITGKVEPPSLLGADEALRVVEPPILDTGRFSFRALPADIEVLNRRALQKGDLDITALSVRTWADVHDRYIVTACGGSFGDGYGPRLVARTSDSQVLCEACLSKPGLVFAIPGAGTTAYLLLRLMLESQRRNGSTCGGPPDAGAPPARFVEMRFDRIIDAIVQGEADVGLLIHEGQISFKDAGLSLVADTGAWWKERTGLKLPLGVNAIRRDLEARFGPGSVAEIAETLRRSVATAMERWHESVRYAMGFALANLKRGMGGEATFERVDQYCRMYVTDETLDMGEAGRNAIQRLLAEGAAQGLCPAVGDVELV
jgi:1,4-dihydroxy-6-naphthoate synthase